MKKIVLAFFAMMFCINISAQGFMGGGMPPMGGAMPELKPETIAKQQADRLKKKCKLDDKQYEAVYDLYLNQAKEMQEAFKNFNFDDPSEMMKKMKERTEKMNKDMKEILTEEQYKKYEKIAKRGFAPQGGFGGPRFGGGMPPMGGGFGGGMPMGGFGGPGF